MGEDQQRDIVPAEQTVEVPLPQPKSQVLLIVFALITSNLFALVVTFLFEFLSLRGIVHLMASRIVLGLAWASGAIVVGLWVWGTGIKAKRRTFATGLLILLFLCVALDQWAPKPDPNTAPATLSGVETVFKKYFGGKVPVLMVTPVPSPAPSIPTPNAIPEVTITAPPDSIYNLTWIPKKDMTPRTTLGANYDQPYLEIRKLPLWPPVSVVAVTSNWSVVGESTKSIFLGSNHFTKFGSTVGADGGPGSMFQIGNSGPSLAVADTIQISLDHVSDDPEKMNIPPQFWNGFILRLLALQERPSENGPPEGMWKDRMTIGAIFLKYRSKDVWYTRRFRIEAVINPLPDSSYYAGFTIPSVGPEFGSPDDLRAMIRILSTQYQ
jgi:hypothetical protein